MLIALLVVLGVDLIVVIAFVAVVVGRRRHLAHQPGDFFGAIRVVSGDIDGLGATWKRGSGRWVRDVLVWNKAPFMYRTVLIPADRITSQRQAAAREVKRLGDDPVVVALACERATVELAVRADDGGLLVGSLSPGASALPPTTTPN